MHFQLQAKGAVELAGFASICQEKCIKKKQEANSFANSFYYNNEQEPTSVLHMRRSQSPPTSASTLSSSFNGGAAGAGVGGNSTYNTTTTTAATIAPPPETPLPNSNNKEEWATELQPIRSGFDLVPGPGGAQRCNLGLEDWETMLSESAVLPSQDHSILRWIAGDVDDHSFGLKQLLQSGSGGPNQGLDFEGNAGLGVVDQGPGFDPIGSLASSGAGNVISSAAPNSGFFPGSGFVLNANNNGNGKIGSVMPSSSSVGDLVNNHKVLGTTSGLNTNIQNPMFASCLGNNIGLPVSLPMLYQQQQQQDQYFESLEEKPQIVNPQVLMGQQNPNFFLPLPQEQHLLQPLPKRLNSGNLELSSQIPNLPFSDAGHELFIRKQQQQQHMGFPQGVQFIPQQKPMMVAKQKVLLGPGEEMAQQQYQLHQQQEATLIELLYKAAELVGTGNFQHAQGILARLNHQLSSVGKPLQRAAFYFKDALQLLLLMNNPVSPPPPRSPTPFDVIFKMGAYKVFSEVSPLIQFVNFTCNQALLEALDDADRVHIVDFDIGFGAQWASFMQELPMRSRGAPSLRITAFASPSTHHPIELGLMRDNLMQFANEIGVSFELEVLNFDSLDQTPYSMPMFRSNENEAVAVNFPVWSCSNQPSALPNLLRFVKQLSPKIVVSLDRGCDRNDMSFPQHIIHAFQSYINLLESLDAANVTSDAVNKIERFLLVPRIESTVLGRLHALEKMPLWKTLFSSAGFTPLTFSNFTETQAECVVKRAQVRGFHVEKRQASLVLCWQQRDLISASAWRC